AISNIALDLIGQARNFYQYAALLINQSNEQTQSDKSSFPSPGGGGWVGAVTEDSLAYFRNTTDFKNCLLVELEKGDWAMTTLRQFFFSTYQFYFYQQLQKSKDKTLAAIAEKSLKEVTYHLRWSAEWVIRLGDGTEESNPRINEALQILWPYTAELIMNADYETALLENGIAVDLNLIQDQWMKKIKEVFTSATLQIAEKGDALTGGKQGKHTENLTALLEEMQILQRTYPGAEW
ncbi:MAG: 1,2-phenylacetyl-CoA epoxidase subunit PaaC, partial [Bacteroidota bacterium]